MSVIDKLNQIKSCKEDIKQAIIDKGVDMTDTPFTEYATKISEIQAGSGSSDYLEIRNNLTTYTNREIEAIGEYSFINCSNLTSVNLPNVKRITSGAFKSCGSLSSVNIPECEYVGYEGFSDCRSLQAIDIPECKEIAGGSFINCISLASVNIPKCKKIEHSVFVSCNSLQAIDLPLCEEIGGSVFSDTSLTSIYLPECYKVDSNAFYSISELKTANLPKCEILGGSTFEWCENLTSVNIPICNNIGWATFNGCRSLVELDLSKTYRCSLETPEAFNESPLRNGEGSIYVHNSVLSQFQNAENWSEFADRFVGVGEEGEVMLKFENGVLSGDTYVINNNFEEYLGISKSDITQINLPKVQRLNWNDWSEGVQFSYCENLTSINFESATHIGRQMFSDCYSLNTVKLDSCTYIGDTAFGACSSLTELNLPNCSYIGYDAFTYCQNLKTLTIGTNLTTVCEAEFLGSNLNNLEKIYVSGSLVEEYKSHPYWSQFADIIESNEHIGFKDGRLYGRTTAISTNEINNLGISKSDITSVDLPNCEIVYQNTFKDCVNLQSVNLPNCGRVGYNAFDTCVLLTSIDLPSCTYIDNSAFIGCSNLQYANLPQCQYVGYNALQECGFTSIDLPNCTEIQNSGLSGCANLQYANLPKCTYLGWGVFDNTVLKELHIATYSESVCEAPGAGIPESIEKIFVFPDNVDGYKAHEYWSAFADVIEGETVLRVSNGCLTGNLTEIFQSWRDEYGIYDGITSIDLPLCHNVGNDSFYNINGLERVNLPTCWVIEINAFAYCHDLKYITLNECNDIGESAFRSCTALNEISLPMCHTISDQAFYECNMLETAELPECSSIGYQAFYGGAELRTMYVGTEINEVCSVGDEAIPALNMTAIYVPASLVEDYKTTPVWSDFADKFVGV